MCNFWHYVKVGSSRTTFGVARYLWDYGVIAGEVRSMSAAYTRL